MAPSSAQQSSGSSRRPAVTTGLVSDLLDVSFTRFVSLRLLSLLYVVVLVMATLYALVRIIAGFGSNLVSGVVALLFAVLGWVLTVALARVVLEGFAVLFRLNDTADRLLDAVSGDVGAAVHVPPADQQRRAAPARDRGAPDQAARQAVRTAPPAEPGPSTGASAPVTGQVTGPARSTSGSAGGPQPRAGEAGSTPPDPGPRTQIFGPPVVPPAPEPYPPQPYPAQQYPPQAYPAQQYPPQQAYPAQQYPSETYPPEPYPAHPDPTQDPRYPDPRYAERPYTRPPYPSHPDPTQPPYGDQRDPRYADPGYVDPRAQPAPSDRRPAEPQAPDEEDPRRPRRSRQELPPAEPPGPPWA